MVSGSSQVANPGLLAIDRYGALERSELRREFDRARPFPHVVLDDVLRADLTVLNEFPGPDWAGWIRFDDDYQPDKRCVTDLAAIPKPFQEILEELHSWRFLEFLESVTGVSGLIPDPWLLGGGLHSSGPGGLLRPHTDFHINDRLRLYRRVNVLLYLNPGWRADFGGCLELHDARLNECVKVILPVYGRLVLFCTDDRSVYGFPKPITTGHRRNSIATYYYTSTPAKGFSGDYTTYWRQHGTSRGVGRVRHGIYRGLLQVSRLFSLAAHMIDPGHGRRWLRSGLDQRRRSRSMLD